MDDDLTYLTKESDDGAKTALQNCGLAGATDYVISHTLTCEGQAAGLTIEQKPFHGNFYHLHMERHSRRREHPHLA